MMAVPFDHAVSPRYTVSKLASQAIGDRIDVYEDRMRGWLLGPARALLNGVPHSEIAVLTLCLGYFEGWEQYRSGEDSDGRSRVFFRRAFFTVFPNIDFGGIARREGDEAVIADALYEQIRCGMAHDGLPRRKVFIAKMDVPIGISVPESGLAGEVGAIFVDPRHLLDQIEGHFDRYITALRDPSSAELRKNFTRTWERANAGSPVIVPAALPRRPS